ncbi:MAG: UDP-N-acetylmuramoyl-L-alanyl-D-glutamate--2,6-diaminopimelate ligase [Proteobacteria bacterium]|nr:UDP-N-acetylmuramoyl-L-alanyl-D-glutamate--2,6-diaminopimelate ligase [Pseudomonadota bacterium]
MRLNQLITADAAVRCSDPTLDPEIAGLTADSRDVKAGYLFAALPGARVDGRAFAAEAVSRGAIAVLGVSGLDLPTGVARAETANPRRAFALMAARFYGRQPKIVAAVTGTNGKTSVAAFARQMWTMLGHQAASLGTLGLIAPERTRPGALTTPDPVALHRDLAELAATGVDHVALEASSHGLDQFRLDGVRVAAAAFTNITHEHLDYHGTMLTYFAAKRRLFETVMPAGGTAVINADVDEFDELAALCRRRGHHLIDFGRKAKTLRLLRAAPLATGQHLAVEVQGTAYQVLLPLIAEFQAMNALAALGVVIGCGAEAPRVVPLLERLEGVPGRLQHAATRRNGAAVYVDYAHKPNALETVLKVLRPYTQKRLHVVFGCGGDRDTAKRPLMGEIAARLADRVIVTDDNPRSEDPAAIRRQILAASLNATEIGSRRAAIFRAVATLDPGDMLVIAGKGHERGQIVGGTVHPFDDVEVAREAVATADGGKA